jgi:hypothetical protein
MNVFIHAAFQRERNATMEVETCNIKKSIKEVFSPQHKDRPVRDSPRGYYKREGEGEMRFPCSTQK